MPMQGMQRVRPKWSATSDIASLHAKFPSFPIGTSVKNHVNVLSSIITCLLYLLDYYWPQRQAVLKINLHLKFFLPTHFLTIPSFFFASFTHCLSRSVLAILLAVSRRAIAFFLSTPVNMMTRMQLSTTVFA